MQKGGRFTRCGGLCVAALLGLLSGLPASVSCGQTLSTANPVAQADELEAVTLVLTYARQQVPLLRPEQFDIRMDGGHPFHPTAARLVGDEPLNMAVLIDDSRDPFKTLGQFAGSISALVPKVLHPADHVTVYALDCALARTMDDAPANPEAIKDAVANALAYGKLHGTSTKPACGSSLRLWDYAAVAIEALGKQPGRRVLVIVSGGNDKKSKNDWAAVKGSALSHSVAVFGLRDQALFDADEYVPTYTPGAPIGPNGSVAPATPRNIGKREPRPFDLLCGNTGGLVLNTAWGDLDRTMNELMGILRGRYILQFPRGTYSPGGSDTFKITTENNGLFTSAAGVNEIAPAATTP